MTKLKMESMMTDELDDEFEDDDDNSDNAASENYMKTAITGRGVTLHMLINDGIIEPGSGLLTLKYLGRKFIADLLPNGKIMTPATKEMFGTPSAWAAHCKRQVNPHKKSGCGWNSVMYRGKKLDIWKTTWFRKHRPNSPARSSPARIDISSQRLFNFDFNQNGERSSNEASITNNHSDVRNPFDNLQGLTKDHSNQKKEMKHNGRVLSSPPEHSSDIIPPPVDLSIKAPITDNGDIPSSRNSVASSQSDFQEEALNLSLKEPVQSNTVKSGNQDDKRKIQEHISVHHSSLRKGNQNIDPYTFVLCESFKSLGKSQPFTVSLASNAVLLLDFHCHLTSKEVVGYLGGSWNTKTQHLSILEAFPCKCQLTDGQKSSVIEDEIKTLMRRRGLSLVGWYHSHPYNQPDPSVRDIGCQMSYQLRMKGSGATYFPCVGIITSPFYKAQSRKDSSYNMFMVMPPLEEEMSDFGVPMKVTYTLNQNKSVTEELLSEMKSVRDFYKGSPVWTNFDHSYESTVTYVEKLKESLSKNLPEDQMENGTLFDFVEHLVLTKSTE